MSAIPFRTLYDLNLLSPRGLSVLLRGIAREGTNLMLLLHFAAHLYPERIALDDGRETITFAQLYTQSSLLAKAWIQRYKAGRGMRVAILCRNSPSVVRFLFALSRAGVDLYLLNTDMSTEQLSEVVIAQKVHFIVHDDELSIPQPEPSKTAVIMLPLSSAVDANKMFSTVAITPRDRLPRGAAGRIVVLTGGSSGSYKSAARKPSVFAFLYPFFALLRDIGLHRYKSVYISTPLYHGFGLATLVVAVLMARRMHIRQGFNAAEACKLIDQGKVEVAITVPTMLRRMLRHDAGALRSLRCILSGGAPLSTALSAETAAILGPVLHNLYGTSEAGFFVLARPADLLKYPGTIGRPIRGVKVRLEGEENNEGRLCVRCGWAMDSRRSQWQDTGDRAYRNADDYLFLRGRSDSMIVSGGENVYPEEVERLLCTHPLIDEALVIPIDDVQFGQRLGAYVLLSDRAIESSSAAESPTPVLNEEAIRVYLKERVARYQMPAYIHFVRSIPILDTGKVSRSQIPTIGEKSDRDTTP